jgi:flagellar hook-associated protein 3 FlgL
MTPVYSNFNFTSMQSGVATLKLRLEKLQYQISTGRIDKPAVAAGARSGPLFTLRQDATALQAYRDNIATSRTLLQSADLAFEKLSGTADEVKTALLQFASGTISKSQLGSAARRMLESFTDNFETNGGITNPLAGQSARATPLLRYYSTPPGSAQSNYQGSFLATFGFSIDDLQAQALSQSQISSFVDSIRTGYESPQSWEQLWLAGPVASLDVPVSTSWKVKSPTVVSEDGIKSTASVLVNLAEMANVQLTDQAFQGVVSDLIKSIGVAAQGIIETRAGIGAQLSKLNQLDESYQKKQTGIDVALSSLEGVDQYAAVTEVNALQSQLEISYKITSQMQNLFLANFI